MINSLLNLCIREYGSYPLLQSGFIRYPPRLQLGGYCSDLLCTFVSEKITMLIAICILQLQSHQMSQGTTPLLVLKESVLSLKMGYRILTNTGMGPYIQQQGLCTAFTVASLGDLGGFSPCIGRALGETRARKLLIHGTGKCVRALRWQYPYFGLKVKGHRYGFSHQIPYGHIKHIVINHNDTKARH